jgi:hypothetical protein
MPRIILPDGTVKYYETEEQLEEELQQTKPAAPTITQQKPAPAQASKPAPAKPKQDPPSWWDETLRTISTAAVQIPTKVVQGVQALGQALPPSALGTPMGGEPLAGLYVKGAGKPEQMKQVAQKEVQLAKRGQRAASLGISIPTEKGEVYKLGIPKEAPGGSLLSEEGANFKAIKPRTPLGQGIADVGSAIVMSFALPNFGGTHGANLATLRNVIKPGFSNSLRGGLEIAKRVGADLPQDFVEELLFFAAPEPSEDEQRLVDQMLSATDPKVKKAMQEMLLADDDATVKFYNKWLLNAIGNTAASAVIRGNLAVLNQTRRATAAARIKGKKVNLEEVEKQAAPLVKEVQGVVDSDVAALRQRLEMDEVAELNSQFTSTVRGNIELLSSRVRGLSQADLATQKAQGEGEMAATELIGVTAKATEDRAQIKRLGDLIKARSVSLKEMDKLEAQNPGYLTGSNKARYNRYQKQLFEYKDQLDALGKGVTERTQATEGFTQQLQMSAAQAESLAAARRSGVDSFVNELEPWFNNLETINNRRAMLAPDMSMSEDPYYQSYQRIKEAYDNYKLYGGKEAAQGADIDPSQEQTRLAFEARLFDTIQEEFDRLQADAGGAGPIEVDPAAYEAAQKLNEAPAGATEEAVEAAEAVPPAEAMPPTEGVKAPPSGVKEAGTEMPDPWTMSTQVPLKVDEVGNVVADPDPVRTPGITEGIPQNKDARIRQAQVDLGIRNPDQVEEIVDDIQRFTTEEAVDDYVRYSNEIAEMEARSPDGVSYDWDRDSTKALERVVGNYDTQATRKLAILQALKRKGGKIENYTPKALERIYKIAGKYANAENDFVQLLDILNRAGLKRQKAIKGVEDAHVEVFATAIELQVGSNRLLKVVDAMTTQADALSPEEIQTYRAIAAQEGLLLYQSVGDFMTLRNRASSLLASFKQGILGKVQDMYLKVSQKKSKGLDADQLIENYVKDIQSFQAQLAEQISDDVGNYIGLPSNLRNVEDVLNKFRDPDLSPDEADLALFNKIISKLTVAGANPEALGSLMITGDEIVQRQMKAGGLSNIKTQTSFPPQTAIYGGAFWLDGLTTGKINKFWSSIPWLKDDEATQFAVGQERIYRTMMEQDFTQMAGNVANWVYKSRQFNRSIITDAITPIDNSGKFEADVRVKDPIRESQVLGILNDSEGISDKGVLGMLKRRLGEEQVQKLRNHTLVNWFQFHDQFWLGDAYKEMPDTAMGRYAKFRYDFSPQGAFDRFLLPRLTKDAVTPFESKLASGERLGGSLPLAASEISTEFIGGTMANLYARAKAQIEVEDMVDAAGRPMYVKGTEAFESAVDKKYYEEYLRPVSVGVGDKAEDIAYAVADRDAQYLALAMDMMMPMEDDAWKAMYDRLKSRGADGDVNWFTTFLTPYIKTPLNAHKHHFYYTQPLPGTPVPTGIALEAGVGLRRFLDKNPDSDKLATSILGFQSKLFSKDPATRARARSGLTLSTAMNVGVLSLVESNALEITGGQRDQYQEANGAYIPMYSIKIGGQWVPYRWLPYVGELLAYAANFRDFRKSATDSDVTRVVGSAIMAMGATLMDTPALAGIDTAISILQKPKDAEYFILDFAERVGGVRFPGLRQGILRATNEAYGARPVLSGEAAGVVSVKEPDPRLGEEVSYWEQWGEGVKDVMNIGKFLAQGGALLANRLGLLPFAEGMDSFLSDARIKAVKQGDYRQAHWYKSGDIMYTGPTQASVMTTFLGRHWPVPNASDAVDMELFRHGIKPPGQVFQAKYGIMANDVMINRFRRFMGTEYRDEKGRSVYQAFNDLIQNREAIPGTNNVYYKDLIDDPKNSLTLDAKQAPYVDTTDQVTKRMALMELRSTMIRDAAEQFLNNGIEVVDEAGRVTVKPITYGAPIDAQKAFQRYSKAKTEQEILKLVY